MVLTKFPPSTAPALVEAAAHATARRDQEGGLRAAYLTVERSPANLEGGEIHLLSNTNGEGFHLDYFQGTFRVFSGGSVFLAASSAVGFTDANGWYVDATAGGRRTWRKRFLGLALPAASAHHLGLASLPVGVANMGAVYVKYWHRMGGNAEQVNIAHWATDATTTLDMVVATIDGTTLSSKATTIDLYVELTAV